MVGVYQFLFIDKWWNRFISSWRNQNPLTFSPRPPQPLPPPQPGDNYPSVPKCQLLNFYLEMILAGKFQPIGDTADAQWGTMFICPFYNNPNFFLHTLTRVPLKVRKYHDIYKIWGYLEIFMDFRTSHTWVFSVISVLIINYLPGS